MYTVYCILYTIYCVLFTVLYAGSITSFAILYTFAFHQVKRDDDKKCRQGPVTIRKMNSSTPVTVTYSKNVTVDRRCLNWFTHYTCISFRWKSIFEFHEESFFEEEERDNHKTTSKSEWPERMKYFRTCYFAIFDTTDFNRLLFGLLSISSSNRTFRAWRRSLSIKVFSPATIPFLSRVFLFFHSRGFRLQVMRLRYKRQSFVSGIVCFSFQDWSKEFWDEGIVLRAGISSLACLLIRPMTVFRRSRGHARPNKNNTFEIWAGQFTKPCTDAWPEEVLYRYTVVVYHAPCTSESVLPIRLSFMRRSMSHSMVDIKLPLKVRSLSVVYCSKLCMKNKNFLSFDPLRRILAGIRSWCGGEPRCNCVRFLWHQGRGFRSVELMYMWYCAQFHYQVEPTSSDITWNKSWMLKTENAPCGLLTWRNDRFWILFVCMYAYWRTLMEGVAHKASSSQRGHSQSTPSLLPNSKWVTRVPWSPP